MREGDITVLMTRGHRQSLEHALLGIAHSVRNRPRGAYCWRICCGYVQPLRLYLNTLVKRRWSRPSPPNASCSIRRGDLHAMDFSPCALAAATPLSDVAGAFAPSSQETALPLLEILTALVRVLTKTKEAMVGLCSAGEARDVGLLT